MLTLFGRLGLLLLFLAPCLHASPFTVAVLLVTSAEAPLARDSEVMLALGQQVKSLPTRPRVVAYRYDDARHQHYCTTKLLITAADLPLLAVVETDEQGYPQRVLQKWAKVDSRNSDQVATDIVAVLRKVPATGMPPSQPTHSSDGMADASLLIRRHGKRHDQLNIRVRLSNHSDIPVEGPLSATLYVRETHQEKWRLLVEFRGIPAIPAGHKQARDYIPDVTRPLDPALETDAFQVRAEISGSDGRRWSVESQFIQETTDQLEKGEASDV